MHIEIKCPNCFLPAKRNDLDLEEQRGYCTECKEHYAFDINVIRTKHEVFLPENFEYIVGDDMMELIIPWKTNRPEVFHKPMKHGRIIVPILFFGIPTITFLILTNGWFPKDVVYTIIGLVGIVVLLIILALFSSKYFKLKLNSSAIFINHKRLHIVLAQQSTDNDGNTAFPVKNSPFIIDPMNVVQVYVQETGKLNYEVVIVDNEDKHHNPLYPFFRFDHASFIEQEMEKVLKIKDQKVDKEIKL